MDLSTPELAQQAFYQAFESCNLEQMMAVWSARDDIVCIHPGSVALSGVAAIERSWQLILEQGEQMSITTSLVGSTLTPSLATFIVTEHLLLSARNLRGETLATNVFRLEDDKWRMTLHHGSSKPAERDMPGTDEGDIVH